MRLIPKNTRVRLQFYKGITFADMFIGLVILFVVAVVVLSNLPNKFAIALCIVCLALPLFLPVGGEKIYLSIFYIVKYLFCKNKYKEAEIENLLHYQSVETDCIKNKDGNFIGVIEVKPIEFRLLGDNKQDGLIDGVFARVIESIGSNQEAFLIKLDKSFNFDNHLQNELERLSVVLQNKEKGLLSDKEYEARVDIIEDRMTLLDNLNTHEQINYSAYYLAISDLDKNNLQSCLQYARQLFNSGSIEANILQGSQLFEFLKDFNGSTEPNAISLKAVLPKQIEFGTMSAKQNGKKLTHFVLCDYPLRVSNAWGESLFDISNTKVIMKLKPIEKFKAIRRIDNAIMELSSQTMGKASKIIDRDTHIETLSNLLTRLQNDNETLLDVTVIVTAYDDKASNTVKKNVKRKLREMGISVNEMFARQMDAYLTSNLSCCDKVKLSRGIQSTTVAACFPFVSDALVDDKGIILGENKLPAMIDFWKRDNDRINSNIVVIGKSGSGKSFAVKTLLAHLSTCDTRIFIIDPDGEYSRLAERLGGKVFDIASAKHGRLNPFQIIFGLDDENEDGTHNSFFSHLQFLEEFFRLILAGINTDCIELVNRLVLEMYLAKNITAETNLAKLSPQDYPIMDDLHQLIETKLGYEADEYTRSCLKILLNYISKFKSGGRNSQLWNGASSFNATENFVCFNFQKLLANKNTPIANAQMLLVLKWIENEVIKNRDYNLKHGTARKIVVVEDEAHAIIDEKYPIALDFTFQIGKRIRKYEGMLIVVTQNVKDFLGTPEIARKSMAIINVSQYSLIFSLSPDDMTDLCALYEKAGTINKVEADNIVYNSCGCAFLISSPQNRTNLQISATPFIRSLFDETKQLLN